jgi:DNA-binding transcriptional regulator GbsR (MarR family)
MAEPAGHDEAILRVADAVGGLMEFWGFKRNMGRMWTVLYTEPKPLSAADLAERLSLSSGAVSMLLSDLTQWGVVKKAWVPGERRDYYEAEPSIWKMVSRVFRERELRQIQEAIEVFADATDSLEASAERSENDSDRERAALALERIQGLAQLAMIGRQLLDAILSGESVDASPLQFFKLPDKE